MGFVVEFEAVDQLWAACGGVDGVVLAGDECRGGFEVEVAVLFVVVVLEGDVVCILELVGDADRVAVGLGLHAVEVLIAAGAGDDVGYLSAIGGFGVALEVVDVASEDEVGSTLG